MSHCLLSYSKICLSIVLLYVLTPPALSQMNNKPIKILVNNWTSQIVLSHIVGEIFISRGYKVEFVPSEVDGQWYRLKFGIAHVQVEVWEGTMADKYDQLLKSKTIVDAGNHAAITREDWWYPSYVENVCSGLPKWTALNECYELFIDSRSVPKGMYLGGPWEKPDAAKIRALGLNFKLVKAESADELKQHLENAVAEKKPILLFNWTPNWVENRIEGKFIEFPDYAPECETVPEWGINPKYPWDCGNPRNGWLKKVASLTFSERWPCAFDILKNFNFSNQMIAEVASWVDVDKLTYREATTLWLSKYRDKWLSWIPSQCAH